MFDHIDDDNSGEISYKEFKSAFVAQGDEQIHKTRMSELDFNNDDEISFPEFCVGIAVWVGFAEQL
eukprot:TRINITY_DN1892_c0_g1_i1.p1 TRINITY_DN1892_c0_g1~~TRINITY_DN1892_c0_g1_i1.p1  ORF type:complete len:66 (-),score=18.08 TRINITY_DN1892_c0_g1_i1:19-216(-)